ncbi:hypothetical protein H920_10790 [Fukomys damarensis]|uniref:Uncharacterized protein n=1 Tax=Fukomys damarensis TaxID=885580 RepID=A0A091DC08_FUKDA|nr:hypothetical protein H920_10790 [Fukomys damarensis]
MSYHTSPLPESDLACLSNDLLDVPEEPKLEHTDLVLAICQGSSAGPLSRMPLQGAINSTVYAAAERHPMGRQLIKTLQCILVHLNAQIWHCVTSGSSPKSK